MRVIAGLKKGHKLKGPKGNDTRPTEGRVKESLFNILGPINSEAIILDLFAGSGSIGIEFLSRGASKAYFIDCSSPSIKAIRDNLAHTKLTGQAEVIKNDSIRAINILGNKNLIFDYIFIDPPYGKNLIMKSIEKIGEEEILSEDGVIIVEHESDLDLDKGISSFIKRDKRKYGGKTLSFYKK